MWDRKELKERGREAFRSNRITCIFAAFLLALVNGGAGGAGASANVNVDQETMQKLDLPPEVIKMIIVAIGVIAVIGFVLSIFVFNPVHVGLRKFFLDNTSEPAAGLRRENIGIAFSDGNYTNVVAAVFTTQLFIFLWSLLFIVPGIIKSYSWRMVPYIIAEDPQITGTEARQRSADMMYGSRWNSFVLDLSFLGWALLGVITLGIGNLIWTTPYQACTDAELYLALKAPSAAAAEQMPDIYVE